MSKDRIPVSPAREDWIREGHDWAERVAGVLGAEALRVDHVGSTAVPGLAAKDVIDIQAIVMRLDPEEEIAALMEAEGFRRKHARETEDRHDGLDGPPELRAWRKLFFREPEGERRVHIHIRRNGADNARFSLLLRDFLRADEAARVSYEAFKLALWEVTVKSPKAYARIKQPYIAMTLRAAESWASSTRWRPGAPDAYWRSAE